MPLPGTSLVFACCLALTDVLEDNDAVYVWSPWLLQGLWESWERMQTTSGAPELAATPKCQL